MGNEINDALGIKSTSSEKDSSPKDTSGYNNQNVTLKIIAAIAVVAIIFLPVAGCGNESVNGLKIISAKEKDVSVVVKFFIIASIVSGCIIFFLKESIHMAISSIAGILTLLISYFIAKDKMEGYLDLKIGSYLAIFGYGAIALLSFLKISGKNASNLPPMIALNLEEKEKKALSNDSISQIEKLNDLKLKGIITEEEFVKKKTELLDKL